MSLPTLLRSMFGKEAAAPDRRAVPRLHFPAHTAIRLIIKPSYRQHLAVLYNVSETGLAFILERALEPGTKVAVLIRGPDYFSIVTAQVIHCSPQSEQRWLSGCCFTRALTDREFCMLLGYQPQHGS